MSDLPGFIQRTSCRGCLSSDLQLILRLAPTPPGDHFVTPAQLNDPQPVYPLDLVMCGACGLAQLPGVVDPELIYRDYLYNTSISLGLVEHFDRYAEMVVRTITPAPGALAIDIGSNDGTLLKAFAGRGLRVLGIDPAAEAARMATAAGIETLQSFFTKAYGEELRAQRGAAALVTANNVFANIDDLDDFVAGVRAVLAPDGVFVFETGYFPDLVRDRIIDNIHHEHLSYFAVKPLMTLFARHGMAIESVHHEPTKGGSIRCFVRPEGHASAKLAPGDMHDLIADETAGGYDRVIAMQPFAQGLEALKVELADLVAGLRAQGRTIAGYGASVGVTTLLYYFDVHDAVAYLVDDNPKRPGLYSPGRHVPVLASSELAQRKPDDVIVFAWRYAEPIIQKNAAYLDAGGRFIIPLPVISFAGATAPTPAP